jgi:hypothetical protein
MSFRLDDDFILANIIAEDDKLLFLTARGKLIILNARDDASYTTKVAKELDNILVHAVTELANNKYVYILWSGEEEGRKIGRLNVKNLMFESNAVTVDQHPFDIAWDEENGSLLFIGADYRVYLCDESKVVDNCGSKEQLVPDSGYFSLDTDASQLAIFLLKKSTGRNDTMWCYHKGTIRQINTWTGESILGMDQSSRVLTFKQGACYGEGEKVKSDILIHEENGNVKKIAMDGVVFISKHDDKLIAVHNEGGDQYRVKIGIYSGKSGEVHWK